MATYRVTDTQLTSIADAIRTKGGTTANLAFPAGFVSAIENIQASSETESLTITRNGTYTAPAGKTYNPITVNIPKSQISVVDTIDEHGGTVRNVYAIDAVVFIDYDGTIITTKSAAEINAMSSDSDLPANPTHEGLTAQGWNWTVAQLKAQLTAMPDQTIYVGQMYVTTSGATEIDVEIHEGRLSPILTICVNGTVSVDWGDGTTADTVTGTSVSTRQSPSHTYANAGNYTITITETSGSEYAFRGSGSYTILRKNTVQNENYTYASCVNKIRLGSGIKHIADYAFCYCRNLVSITIPSSVASVESGAFSYCYSITSVTIPSGVTNILGSAFLYCYVLESIAIPSSVANIRSNAFQYCYVLTSITIPSDMASIGDNAFSNCYSLASITIPSGITSIGNSAFSDCTSLASITIPSGVTSIGNGTFSNCYSLASITIPSSVTSIGTYAFQHCRSLTNITIPSGVKSIGTYAFQNCRSLTNITIPSGVTSIGTYAFQSCYSLADITIPSDVTSIGDYAFQNCYSLASVTIPSSMTSIGNSAFAYCYSLTRVTIPSDITSMGNSAFQYCYGVSEYHVKPTTPPTLGTTVFGYIVSDCVIYVPQGKLSDYQNATDWSAYASYMQEESAS